MKIQFVIIFIITMGACVSDPVEQVATNNPGELQSYFDSFESEARARNININLAALDLSAEINEIDEEHVAGTCFYSSQAGNHITIDRSFWERANHLTREMVVFHELGHCVLAQGHREQTDQNGNCLSIMQSGTEDCTLLYNGQNRDYYLDELFFFAD